MKQVCPVCEKKLKNFKEFSDHLAKKHKLYTVDKWIKGEK